MSHHESAHTAEQRIERNKHIERNKEIVRRLIDEVMNAGNLSLLDELYDSRLVPAARHWIEPFRESFSDIHIRIQELIGEDDTVVARLTCSGTHNSTWLGHPPTGRRFTDIAEVYIFRIREGRVTRAWGIEDSHERLRQLGLDTLSDF